MQSNLEINKNFFGQFKSLTYSCSANLGSLENKELFKVCIETIEELKSESSLFRNLKGFDQHNFVQDLEQNQQLFSYNVSFESEDKKIIHSDFYLTTPFDSFIASDILHSSKIISDSELQIDSPLLRPALNLESFILAVDFYAMNSFYNWFFKTPVVVESFFISVTTNNLKICLQSEMTPDKLITLSKLSTLIETLKRSLNYDLKQNLESHYDH